MARIAPSWLTQGTRKLVLLPPKGTTVPDVFRCLAYDPHLYNQLLENMQRLRGSAYLRDGAVQSSDLTRDGRHISEADERGWHILSVESNGEVSGCARYLAYDNRVSYSDLMITNSALAEDPEWREPLRRAVESEIELARKLGVAYVEVGGWALDDRVRFTSEALRIALATYALSRNLGGCIGISTVTVRHCSSTILQRIGGAVLSLNGTALPLYYDAQYQCDMTILRFDASELNPRYEPALQHLRGQLRNVSVVADASPEVYISDHRPVFACA